jgi:hypothetical protein
MLGSKDFGEGTMRTATDNARKFFFRLFPDRLDFRGDTMNISYRTLHDIGLIRGGYAPRPDMHWVN